MAIAAEALSGAISTASAWCWRACALEVEPLGPTDALRHPVHPGRLVCVRRRVAGFVGPTNGNAHCVKAHAGNGAEIRPFNISTPVAFTGQTFDLATHSHPKPHRNVLF